MRDWRNGKPTEIYRATFGLLNRTEPNWIHTFPKDIKI